MVRWRLGAYSVCAREPEVAYMWAVFFLFFILKTRWWWLASTLMDCGSGWAITYGIPGTSWEGLMTLLPGIDFLFFADSFVYYFFGG